MQPSQVPYSAIVLQAASLRTERNTSRLMLKPYSHMHDEIRADCNGQCDVVWLHERAWR